MHVLVLPQLAEVDALTETAQQQQQHQQHQQQVIYSSLDDEEIEQLSAYKEVILFFLLSPYQDVEFRFRVPKVLCSRA